VRRGAGRALPRRAGLGQSGRVAGQTGGDLTSVVTTRPRRREALPPPRTVSCGSVP